MTKTRKNNIYIYIYILERTHPYMDGVEWLLAKWLPSHGYPMGFSALSVSERVFERVFERFVFLSVCGSWQSGFQVTGYPMGFSALSVSERVFAPSNMISKSWGILWGSVVFE